VPSPFHETTRRQEHSRKPFTRPAIARLQSEWIQVNNTQANHSDSVDNETVCSQKLSLCVNMHERRLTLRRHSVIPQTPRRMIKSTRDLILTHALVLKQLAVE
jgi:hypothetical protein